MRCVRGTHKDAPQNRRCIAKRRIVGNNRDKTGGGNADGQRRPREQLLWAGMYAKGEESMRRYVDGQDKRLMKVVCNKCGKALRVEDGYLKEFCFAADVAFGYFSRKDGTMQHFDLCEDCYDEWTAQFRLPVEEAENLELL